MKILALLLGLVLCAAAPSWGAIALVGSGEVATHGPLCDGTAPKAFTGGVNSGELLVASGVVQDLAAASPTAMAATDTVGTTYSVLLSTELTAVNKTRAFIIYGLAAGTGANSITITCTGGTGPAAGQSMKYVIGRFSGVHATPLDVAGGSSTASGSATPADEITTITANDLVIGVAYYESGSDTTMTPGGAWTQLGEDETDTNSPLSTNVNVEFAIVTTAQLYTVDWTLGASKFWTAATAAFKPAVATSKIMLKLKP